MNDPYTRPHDPWSSLDYGHKYMPIVIEDVPSPSPLHSSSSSSSSSSHLELKKRNIGQNYDDEPLNLDGLASANHYHHHIHIGDRFEDTAISGSEPLRPIEIGKIVLGLVFVFFVLPMAASMAYYIYDNSFTFSCKFFPNFCDIFATGCDGWVASGKTYDSCGVCGGDNSTC